MFEIGRNRVTRLAFLLGVAMALGATFFTPGVAAAGPLDGLTAPVEETARTATSAVNEIAATVTGSPPVASTPQVPPVGGKEPSPVAAATSQTISKVKQLAAPGGKAPLPADKLPAPTGGPPASLGDDGGASSAGPVTRTVETTTQTVARTVETLGKTVESTSSSVVDRATGTAPTAPAGPEDLESPAPESPTPAASTSPAGDASAYVGGGFRPSPSEDGSVRAPLGKWAAYIWPAVALTRAAAPGLVKDWAKDALRLALDPADSTASSGAAQGVAGVHAEHLGGDGSSLFSQIPSALTGGYGPDLPLPVTVFYFLVVIAIFGVLIAMLWDLEYLGRSRRRW
jgi:hypothetical protein